MVSKKFNNCFFISTVLITILSTIFNCQAQTGPYPPLDLPPPFDETWATLVDFTKVPKAPVSKQLNDCPAPGTDIFCSWTCSKCIKPGDVLNCPTIKDWAFTFDDGPTTATSILLDYLDTINKKVTFFVVGSRVVSNPDILKRAIASGHQVGVHTWSHTPLTTQTNEQIVAEIKWTERAIQNYGGVTPNLLRPPAGDYDDRVREIARQLGYTIVLWELDSFDWELIANPTYPIDYVIGNFTLWASNTTATTGHISLEHDLFNATVGVAPQVFPMIINKGFNVKTIGECINKPLFNPLQNTTTTPTTPIATGAPLVRRRQLFKKRYLKA